jgi:hypothetical protein
MGIMRRVERCEKSSVKPRTEDVTPEYFDRGLAPRQSEALGRLNFGGHGGYRTRLVPARTSKGTVALRDHPSMRYRTRANWPLIWTRRGRTNRAAGQAASLLVRRGEIGILKEAFISAGARPPRIYLIMADDGCEYVGSLLFNDSASCRAIYALLKRHCGESIAEIGALEVSYFD